ncbi:MAG: PAS domain S-box protein, partial [Methanomicrobiales archaeon]|nr:PAS domain S-box protein [Methanomicrobiales archaeon]
MTRGVPREKEPVRGDEQGRILDLIDDGLVITDPSGRILILNSTMERFSGMPREEARGMAIREFISAALVPRLGKKGTESEKLAGLLSTGTEGNEVEFALHAPGGDSWFRFSSRVLTNPPYQGCRIDSYRDVTEEREAERSLREREGRLLAIFLRAMKMSLSRDRELTER